MPQCLATTQKGVRCRNEGRREWAGLCSVHLGTAIRKAPHLSGAQSPGTLDRLADVATIAAALLQIIDFVLKNNIIQVLEQFGYRTGSVPPLTRDGALLLRLQDRYLQLMSSPEAASAAHDLETLGAQFAEWFDGLPTGTNSEISTFLEDAS
jgi:hypothetical protein